MKINKVLEKYKEHHWVQEEASISNHVMESWCTCYLQWINVFKNKNLFQHCFFLVDKDYLMEWSSREEAEKVLKWLLKIYGKDKKYWKKKDEEYQVVCKEIDEIFYFFRDKLDIKSLNKKQLADYLNKLMLLGNRQFSFNLVSEAMDIVDDEHYDELLDNVPKGKRHAVVELLSTPQHISFVERENFELLKLAKKYYKNNKLKKDLNSLVKIKQHLKFHNDIKDHQNNYFWIQNNYKEAKVIKLKYFLESLRSILKDNSLKEINKEISRIQNKKQTLAKESKKTYKNYKISKQAKDFFGILRLLAIWQDRRKENVQKILASVDKILDVPAKEYSLSKKYLREYYISELAKLILEGKKVSASKLKQRQLSLYYCYFDKNGKIKKEIFHNQDARRAKKYFQRRHSTEEELKGFVASKGMSKNIRGKVRIVLDANRAKFNKGEILVTGMTRPEFVPLMKRAKAIITNEGGITTHAAIVSRELGIPCIIGTKNATNILKNGDVIELDINKGIIKKIK
jgi:phosphoenolpyruvate synthase/pyruvate phosphate dikinase